MAFRFSARSINNLIGVHPYLVEIAHEALKRVPYDFIVTCGVRSMAEQRRMVAKGASRTMQSYHLRQEDGYGHAIDIAIIHPNGGVTWENKFYEEEAKIFLDIAKKKGYRLTWGGEWKKLYDTPHFQLSDRYLPIS